MNPQIYTVAEMVALGYATTEAIAGFEYGDLEAILEKDISAAQACEASAHNTNMCLPCLSSNKTLHSAECTIFSVGSILGIQRLLSRLQRCGHVTLSLPR